MGATIHTANGCLVGRFWGGDTRPAIRRGTWILSVNKIGVTGIVPMSSEVGLHQMWYPIWVKYCQTGKIKRDK